MEMKACRAPVETTARETVYMACDANTVQLLESELFPAIAILSAPWQVPLVPVYESSKTPTLNTNRAHHWRSPLIGVCIRMSKMSMILLSASKDSESPSTYT
jgi:hypothetical protein